MVHLKLIRLLDDHLQAAVLSQDGLPHLGYSAGFLLLSTHLPLRSLCGKKGGRKGGRRGGEGKGTIKTQTLRVD